MTERLLSAHDVAERFGIHPKTVSAWERDGTLPRAILIGSKHSKRRCKRWKESDIQAIVDALERNRRES